MFSMFYFNKRKVNKYFLITLILVLLLNIVLKSQNTVNFGISGGTSSYYGDINSSRFLYKPSPSYGIFTRVNFNKFYALKISCDYLKIRGNDMDFKTIIHPERFNYPVSFYTKMITMGAKLEYNFFPYLPDIKIGDWTTYIFGGIAYTMILYNKALNSTITSLPHIALPFGAGLKYSVTRKLSCGLEINFYKSLSDRLDGITNLGNKPSLFYNNDWYYFTGIFITYKFFKFVPDCPAYDKNLSYGRKGKY